MLRGLCCERVSNALVSRAEWSLELVLWDVCLTCVSYGSAVLWGSVGVRWVMLFGVGVVVKKLMLGDSVALVRCNV